MCLWLSWGVILPRHKFESCLLRCCPHEGVNKTGRPHWCCLPALHMPSKGTCLCCNDLCRFGGSREPCPYPQTSSLQLMRKMKTPVTEVQVTIARVPGKPSWEMHVSAGLWRVTGKSGGWGLCNRACGDGGDTKGGACPEQQVPRVDSWECGAWTGAGLEGRPPRWRLGSCFCELWDTLRGRGEPERRECFLPLLVLSASLWQRG